MYCWDSRLEETVKNHFQTTFWLISSWSSPVFFEWKIKNALFMNTSVFLYGSVFPSCELRLCCFCSAVSPSFTSVITSFHPYFMSVPSTFISSFSKMFWLNLHLRETTLLLSNKSFLLLIFCIQSQGYGQPSEVKIKIPWK